MRAGELRHRVIIQKQNDAAAGWGGEKTWSTYATAWASITPALSGRDSEDSGTKKEQSDITHIIGMRYIRGFKPSMRISFEGRIFTPQVIRNVDERNYKLEIEAKEETD